MIYAQTAAPAVEPVTLGEVKAHMRMEEGHEDAFLTALTGIARSHLEHTTGLALVSQGLRLYLDRWPTSGIVRIGRGPVRSIEAVTVYDGDGAPQTVPLSGHWLDGYGRPARLWLPDPPAPGRAVNGIEIDFIAGFGESGADVPAELKRAMLMHVALMFAYRGGVAPADQPAAIPDGYDRLVAPYTRRGL